MDYLWSPWRYSYINRKEEKQACIFCGLGPREADAERLIVHRTELCFVVLNRYPYNSGHIMVVPYAHLGSLEEADAAVTTEIMRLTREAQRHLRGIYRPPGFNIGMNIGACAGAGVAGHIHMHVLPRWPGDANFMTTIGETRILPEELQITYQKLAEAFATS